MQEQNSAANAGYRDSPNKDPSGGQEHGSPD
jgi:hypothetical protein